MAQVVFLGSVPCSSVDWPHGRNLSGFSSPSLPGCNHRLYSRRPRCGVSAVAQVRAHLDFQVLVAPLVLYEDDLELGCLSANHL